MRKNSKLFIFILLTLFISFFSFTLAQVDDDQEVIDLDQPPKQSNDQNIHVLSQQQIDQMIQKPDQQEQQTFTILPDYFNDVPQHLLANPQDIQIAFSHLKTKDFLELILFYKNIQMVHKNLDQLKIKDILKEREGFLRFYALDCDEWKGKVFSQDQNENMFCTSKMVGNLPYFWLVKPPLYDINPYTKKPMEAKKIDFQQKRDKSSFEKFILKNLPDFSVKASNQQNLMTKLDETDDMNSLILFTEKDKTSAFVKALSAQYKDRLQILVINTKKQQPQIASKHDIISYPKFMMAQNTQDGRKYHVYDGKMDLKSLKQFSEKFALSEPIVRTNQTKEKKPKAPKLSYAEADSSNFLSEMTGTHKAVLVYLYKPGSDLKTFNSDIAAKIDGPLKVLTVQCKQQNDQIKKRLQAQKCPSYLFLKPGVTGKDKLLKVKEIVNTSSPKDILQQIKTMYKSKAIQIDNQNISSYLTPILKSYEDFITQQQTEDQEKPIQMTVIYYHKDESDLRLAFKALTTDPIFDGRIKFITVGGAGEQGNEAFNYQKLPTLFVFMPNMKYDQTKKRQGQNTPYLTFEYPKKIKYQEMHQFFSGFVQDVVNNQKAQELRQNSEVLEIKDQQALENICLSKGMICGIGILKDDQIVKLEDQIAVVRDANKEIKGSNKYIYMYINASCHKQLLKIFNLDASFLPTFVFYLPKHQKYSQMIGKFEAASITEQLTKLVQGSVTNLYEMHSQLQLEEENCQVQTFIQENKSQEELDMEKQILDEILAEQRQKKIEAEKEFQEQQKKKKSKGKKSKKKKNKAKKDVQTDL